MWQGLKRWLAPGLGVLAGACTTAPQPEQPTAGPRPALWKVADADTTIYLFGTIHMLPEGLEWQTPAFRQAMSASEALVTEAVIGDDPAVAGQAMTKVAFSPGLPPLAERVPADKRAALAAMIEQTGCPRRRWTGWRPGRRR
jgi:uncharacterized protein YbaP (TraB family)